MDLQPPLATMTMLQICFFALMSYAAAVNLPSARNGEGLERTYHVYEGDDVLITCVVSNVGENTVSWKREVEEKRNDRVSRVLTAGESRVTADERFSILHDKGGDVWVLVIKHAFAADSGIYVCEVNSNPVVRSFHKVNVLSRALQPPENVSNPPFVDGEDLKFDVKNHNYTGCCISKNVTRSCLGFCNIQSILEGTTGQNPENCENDFPDIVKCMADHRNHVPCCAEEGVPDICQDVCRGEYTVITDNIKTHFSCSAYTEQTLACIAEGIELLPSMPEAVEVQSLSENSLEIKWKPPLSNSQTVTSYLINVTALRSFDEIEEDSYVTALDKGGKEESEAVKSLLETKKIEVLSSLQMTEVTNLKPFSMYEVTVTAKNAHGTSLPSFAVRTMTLPTGKIKLKKVTEVSPRLPDVRACCADKGVTHASCLDKLCDPVRSDVASVTDLMICAPWAAITFSCLTNGIDLSPCCKARGLPESCQVLCTGNVTQIDFSYFKCLKHMSDFSSCLFQGYGVLPSEPSGISVSHVNSNFAIIHWEPPLDLANTVLYYDLFYRLLATYDNEYKIVSKVHSPHVLEKLESDAEYEVYVKAVNVYGVGRPSSRILFRTKNKIVEAKIEDASSYNVTQCCVDSGLAEMCMSLCRYDASMTGIKKLASLCSTGFHILVSCGAGGRNHEKCCNRRGVPEACTTLCAGSIANSLLSTATSCIPYIGNIVQCFEEGTGLLPGPIRELHATAVTDDSISVSWEPPYHSNVSDYLVYYSAVNGPLASGSKNPMEVQTNTTNTTVTLGRLEKGKTYRIFVISRNDHGTSLPSTILLINATQSEVGSEGIKGMLSSPHSLAVSSHSANWVTVSWHPPEFRQFSEAVTYRLYHKQASENEFQIVETSLTSHTIENLIPNTQYIAYVLAASKSGLSLPSETLIIWTDPAYPAFVEPPTVHPINLVIEGSSMTILCIAVGTPVPTVSLYISGRLVRQETTRHMVTVIHNVTRDMDHISCYADNGYGTPMQASKRITISHVPQITASGITIANLGDAVVLECQVDAHPEPEMLFWRDHSGKVPIVEEKKHNIRITKKTNEESKWIMSLVIQKLTEEDEGDYFCHAKNAFGSSTQAVSVRIRKEPQSRNVTQCCSDEKVSNSCMDACTFFVDIDVVIDKPECLRDFDKLMKCAADGSDHRSCCARRGVPRRCLDWCRGEPLINNKICVLSYTKQIMSCFHEGREKLPGPPRNVRMEPIDTHSVHIVWDPPEKNPHTVIMYRVFWRQLGSKTPFKNDTKDNRLTIRGLKEGITYECVVKAGNHLGTSTLTEPIRFTTGDKYVVSASTNSDSESSSAGIIVGMSLAVFIAAATFTGALWLLRTKGMLSGKSAVGVAFENPSYLRETNVDRPQDVHSIPETVRANHPNASENASVSSPEAHVLTQQQATNLENLNVSHNSNEIFPSFYEELKLGQDGVGFKRLKP